MRAPTLRLRVLLCLALLGIAVSVGLIVLSAFGLLAAGGYTVVVGLLLGWAVDRGRRALAPTPLPAGRTCSCCTTSQLDPVRIV